MSYFSEFKLYEDGESAIEQAVLTYTGRAVNSSYFGLAGMMHAQEGTGTRAATFFSLFPDSAIRNQYLSYQFHSGPAPGGTQCQLYMGFVIGDDTESRTRLFIRHSLVLSTTVSSLIMWHLLVNIGHEDITSGRQKTASEIAPYRRDDARTDYD